jgi:hypothetical protein
MPATTLSQPVTATAGRLINTRPRHWEVWL